MRKNQSIHHSCFPDGSTVRWLNNTMPKPEVRDMSDKIKASLMRMIHGNKVRKGGIAYGDLPLVEQAKKLIAK